MENVDYYLQNKHYYKRAIPLIYAILSHRIGSEKAIKQPELLEKIRKRLPGFNGRSLRLAIHEIRFQHLIRGLVADRAGFYIETDLRKLMAHAQRLHGYIVTITETHDSLIEDYWHQAKKNNEK